MFKTYEDVLSFNKANLDAFILSGTKLATGMEEVAKELFGFTSKTYDTAVNNLKAVTACKTAAEVLQLQQKLAKESWDRAVAETTRLSEMGSVIGKSVSEPIQARYKAAFEGLTKAA